MKQMQVIQMIHYLKPITPDEYPAIAQRITSYTEEQLNQAYAGLYAKFLERQKEDEEAAKNSSKLKFPDRD